jgi:DNA-binding NtrC family response regulator
MLFRHHEVAAQRFREDPYYRLNVIDLHVPPLRERPEDLRSLAQAFLAQTAARLRRPALTYAPAALDRILQHPWPGNIRQLAHAIERACTLAAGPRIEVDDLPPQLQYAPVSPLAQVVAPPLRVREREHAAAVLARHGGDRRAAAKELEISRSTLYRILHRRR